MPAGVQSRIIVEEHLVIAVPASHDWPCKKKCIWRNLLEPFVALPPHEGSVLGALVNEVPAPLVAEMLGYSYQVTQKHATAAAEPWSRYPRS